MLAGSGLSNMDQPWEQQDFHLRELSLQRWCPGLHGCLDTGAAASNPHYSALGGFEYRSLQRDGTKTLLAR